MRKGRRGFFSVLLGIGAVGGAALFGLRAGGAEAESIVDSKVDGAFNTLTKPVESTAETVLTDGVKALEAAKPFVQQFLHVTQMVQKIGVDKINGFLGALEKLPFVNTTDVRHFVTAINLLLDTKENSLLTLINNLENGITGLKQQIADAQQKAPTEMNNVVSDGVRQVDPIAP